MSEQVTLERKEPSVNAATEPTKKRIGNVALGDLSPGTIKTQRELLSEQTHLDPNFVAHEQLIRDELDKRSDADERLANNSVFIDWANEELGDARYDAIKAAMPLWKKHDGLLEQTTTHNKTIRFNGRDINTEVKYSRLPGVARSEEEQEQFDELERRNDVVSKYIRAIDEKKSQIHDDKLVESRASTAIEYSSKIVSDFEQAVSHHIGILGELNPGLTSALSPEDLARVIGERNDLESKVTKSEDGVSLLEMYRAAIIRKEEQSKELGYTIKEGFEKSDLTRLLNTELRAVVHRDFLKDTDAQAEFREAFKPLSTEHDMIEAIDLVLDKVGVRRLAEERRAQLAQFDADYAALEAA